MIAQLRENNVSVWRDNFMRDLQRVEPAPSVDEVSQRDERAGVTN